MDIKVSSCYIYPLKSGSGISVDKLELTQRGPKYNRLWMLVQDQGPNEGRFITQRDTGCGKLALVEAIPNGDGDIYFSTPDGRKLVVVENDLSCYDSVVQVWGDVCNAKDAGNVAAQWFSEYLMLPCRLVRLPDGFIRLTDKNYSRPGDNVSFADGFPLLVTNLASLEKLRNNFPPNVVIGMERFRPNIVLDGIQPFEEDFIHEIRIADVVLEFVKPCNRCMVTTIDQSEGVSISNEPLETLAQIRRGKGGGLQGVFFGQNAIPRKLGAIAVGDDVEILSKKPRHPALQNTVDNLD